MKLLSTRIAFFIIISFFMACDNEPAAKTVQSVVAEEAVVEEVSDAREAWQKPNLILDEMGNLSDRVVADIGAGTGYFSFRMVDRAKKVIAIEIEDDLIDLMKNLALGLPEASKDKFETRLATTNDPKLAKEEVDDVLIVNVVGYFDNRTDYFKKCYNALSTDGKIHIIDYKVRSLPIEAPEYANRVYIHLIEEELAAAGFKNIKTDDTSLAYQYMIQAEK